MHDIHSLIQQTVTNLIQAQATVVKEEVLAEVQASLDEKINTAIYEVLTEINEEIEAQTTPKTEKPETPEDPENPEPVEP